MRDALALSAILVTVGGAVAQGSVPPDRETFDAGDHYLTQGGTVGLLRVKGMLTVQLRKADGEAALMKRGRPAAAALEGFEVTERTGASRTLVFEAHHEVGRALPGSDKASLDELVARIGRDPSVQFVAPMFVDAESGLQQILTGSIIVKFKSDGSLARLKAARPDLRIGATNPLRGTSDQFVIVIDHPTATGVLDAASALQGVAFVDWAQPNFLAEVRAQATIPNDPRFPQQWHLNNTGQTGALVDADVDAPEAWDTTTGSPCVIVAVIDDGVETTHEDLQANIAINAGEIPNNAVDDDGNGYDDDVNGWDFSLQSCSSNPMTLSPGDNNPNPTNALDNHGTAVAGVAVAAGNNGKGVTGAAWGSKVLPIKVFDGNRFSDTGCLAEAIRYSAGSTKDGTRTWRGADILSISLRFGKFPVLDAAFDYAATTGRNGKGCPVFAASGNDASGYANFEDDIPPGTWYFEWHYRKDATISQGEDTVRVAYVELPDGTVERFDVPGVPAGWNMSPTGNPAWFIEDNPAREYGTGRYQARSAQILDNGLTKMRSRNVVVAADSKVRFKAWVSSELNVDRLEFFEHEVNLNITLGPIFVAGRPSSGVPSITTTPNYPANYGPNIAVGASTDWDYRANYSQFAAPLAFVAPSNGGFARIATTDRTGAAGYNNASSYLSNGSDGFSGTSSATPLAAGVGALLLSKNFYLTANQVRQAMESTCDQIGGIAYPGGSNGFYGHGRINANDALAVIPASPPVCDGHFQCYETRRDIVSLGPVDLRDQFGFVGGVPVQREELLCAPADKNDEQPLAPEGRDHLAGYRIRHPFVRVMNQRVVNQFGEIRVDVIRPDRILVPTRKNLAVPFGPPALCGNGVLDSGEQCDPPGSVGCPPGNATGTFLRCQTDCTCPDPSVDHFECYKIRVTPRTARFVPVQNVRIEDQFMAATVTLRKPVKLCAPVDKNGEALGTENHPGHLLCYRTSRVPFQGSTVYLDNQFGPQAKDLLRRQEFCVPSAKNPPPTSTTTTTTTSTTTTTIDRCGDGNLDPGEQCDPPDEILCPAGSPAAAFLPCNPDCTCAQAFYRDSVDAGDDPFNAGCHLGFDDPACTLNNTTALGDTCINDGLDVREWVDSSCHPALPADDTVHSCGDECEDMGFQGGHCVVLDNFCGSGRPSAQCECND